MEARLNAAALSDPNSLRPQVTISDRDIHSFPALVDSGSTHCFVDPSFANMNSLSLYSVSPIVLRLFDSTTTTIITEATDLPICFPSGNVTPLDSDCKIVLGHNWLTQYNLLIDWVLSSIKFRTSTQQVPTPSSLPDPVAHSLSALRLDATSVLSPSLTNLPQAPGLWAPPIALINAAAFLKACQLGGSQQFSIQLKPDGSFHAALVDAAPNLSSVPEAYHDFANVFSKAKASVLTPHREYDLKIELEEGVPLPPSRLYSLSPVELETLRGFIDKNLHFGFIHPTSSSHAAPVLFVKKKDGSLRLCVDYRGLNKISKKDRYPLPLISNLLNSPSQAKVYMKINLQHAYHLVRIAEGDEWKTAFRTRYGSYKWQVMPFSLTNAPAAFQRFVNSVFVDMLDVCIVVYLDDILVYSDNMEDHTKHVQEVLRRLHQHKLYAKPEKCEFHSDLVEYLGYFLSPDGLTMSQDKVKTICDWPEPHKVKDIQSFLLRELLLSIYI